MTARLVVLISGSGTNLQAILDACAAGTLDAAVVGVIANRRDAFGLIRAETAGIPTCHFLLKRYRNVGRTRAEYDADIAAAAQSFQPNLVVLAGWMHILSPIFLNHFPQKVINLHPAMPGQFAGTHAIERAFMAYRRGEILHSGCMVHFVVPEVDAGPVIATTTVPFQPDDTLETFEARMHATEHRLIVDAIRRVLEKTSNTDAVNRTDYGR